MARIFTILPFILALNLAIPIVNAWSPWSSAYTSPASSALTTAVVIKAAGCNDVSKMGSFSCISGPSPGSTSTTGIFGTVVNTILVFGNWVQAANFLVQLGAGVVVPFFYIASWLGGGNDPSGLLIAGLYQALVWYAYAVALFYIVSGRPLMTSYD